MTQKKAKRPKGWEPTGWRIYARVRGVKGKQSKRIHDPDHLMTPMDLRAERESFRAEVNKKNKVPTKTPAGLFAHDVREKYYAAMDVDHPEDRKREMEYWVEHFGKRTSDSIEPWEIAKLRETMLREGPIWKCVAWDATHPKPKGAKTGRLVLIKEPLSAGAVAKRMRGLQNFFTVLYPQLVPNPVAQAGEPTQPERAPHGLGYDLLEEILAEMPDQGRAARGRLRPDESLSKLRLRVIAKTSFPHKQLKAIGTTDLHLDEVPPWVRLTGRKKGGGTTSVGQPLLKEGADALRALKDAGGLGPFSNSSLWKSFKTALAKVKHAPQNATPYSFRHAFAEEVLRVSKNFTAVQLMLGHKSERMAKVYAKGMIDPVRAALVAELEARGFGR